MAEAARDGSEDRPLRQYVATMVAAFRGSPLRRRLLLLAAGIFAVILATAAGQIVLNRWNQPFYDALQQRNFAGFLHQLWCSSRLQARCWCSTSRSNG